MICCWRCANQPLVWQQLWVWSHSLSVLNKFYEQSLVNNRGFPQTAISRSMTSPASIVIRSGPVYLKWFFSFQFGRWGLRVIYVYSLVEPEVWAFLNSSIAQIPAPNNTLLFLLVLWPHYHPWKLGIMLLLLSSPMMENTVSTFYSRLIFHKVMGAWMGLQTYHVSQRDGHLQGIICVSKG